MRDCSIRKSTTLEKSPSNETSYVPANICFLPEAITTLLIKVSSGDSVLHVANYSGFQVGRDIIIDKDTAWQEVNTIEKFGSIYLREPLRFAHSPGATIDMLRSNGTVVPSGAASNLQSAAAPQIPVFPALPQVPPEGRSSLEPGPHNPIWIVAVLLSCCCCFVSVIFGAFCRGKHGVKSTSGNKRQKGEDSRTLSRTNLKDLPRVSLRDHNSPRGQGETSSLMSQTPPMHPAVLQSKDTYGNDFQLGFAMPEAATSPPRSTPMFGANSIMAPALNAETMNKRFEQALSSAMSGSPPPPPISPGYMPMPQQSPAYSGLSSEAQYMPDASSAFATPAMSGRWR